MKNITISELITNRMKKLNLSKKEVVVRMGYSNITKGLRNLGNFLEGGFLAGDQYIRLAKALEVDESMVVKAMIETHEQEENRKKEQERKAFKPHICAMCELGIPSPIFIGIMTHHSRFVYFEESFLDLTYSDQLMLVQKSILRHFERFDGSISGFRNIIHYVLRRFYDEDEDEILLFDIKGNIIINPAKELKRYPGQPVGLFVNGRKIDHLFKLKNAYASEDKQL
ncbi:MAG: hypothetical protein P9L97_07685 [Candidatus Tenebribacter davisii]|nr:hypothetical protein [Candidatus Tenebribacter davisii]